MSSDEVKVKFVADTTGLQNATVPSQIPASGGGASGGGTSGGGTGGTAGSPGGGGNRNYGPKPPPLPGRDRASFPWEPGWGRELQTDLTAQFAGMLSGINLVNMAWDGAKAAAEKYVEVVKLGIEYSQKIEKVSRVTGLSVEEVQKYGYAAQMSGVSFDTFANAMANANKELGKLNLYGGTSTVALTRLGINVENVKNHSTGAIDVLKKMADAYKKHAETAEMAALGNQLFGGSFKDMIPMLRNGSAEIERIAASAPTVNAQTISASAGFGRSATQILQTGGALAAEDVSGYSKNEAYAASKMSGMVSSGDISAKDAVEKLLNPANRGIGTTIAGSGARFIDYAKRLFNPLAQRVDEDTGTTVSDAAAKLLAGEGIRGAGEDTKTVRERFLAMRGGKVERLSESDKAILSAFDEKIASEGKMNLQSGMFQAASKMQQVGGGDVLSAISRVDFAQQTSDNTRRTAEAVEKIANGSPGGGGRTPAPPDTNGPVAK